MATIDYREYDKMSPFEIKDGLIEARQAQRAEIRACAAQCRTRQSELDRDRAARRLFPVRPVCTRPKCRRAMDNPKAGLAGMPQTDGIAARLEAWLAKHADMPGAEFLSKMVDHGVKAFGFDADAFVFELTDSIIGDNYPVPDRMLVHAEQVAAPVPHVGDVRRQAAAGKFDLYAVEGGTAAMCYIFKSLMANRILKKGDTIAMGTPIFTPYIEIAELEDYAFKAVHIRATQEHRFQYSDEEIKKLEDPKIKAFFVVNPGNPTSMAIDAHDAARSSSIW